MSRPLKFILRVLPDLARDHAPRLARYLRRARAMMKAPLQELDVVLVNDRVMSRLHEQFMGICGPTDVLTFPIDLDARGRPISGEVYVCVPEARRRASVEGSELRDELLLYALHGMLHLCGYDDRTTRDFARMHAREDQILTALGVGRVFAPRSKRTRPASGQARRGAR